MPGIATRMNTVSPRQAGTRATSPPRAITAVPIQTGAEKRELRPVGDDLAVVETSRAGREQEHAREGLLLHLTLNPARHVPACDVDIIDGADAPR